MIMFDFEEINIIMQNLFTDDKEKFIDSLIALKDNTNEVILCHSVDTLIAKIIDLSSEEFTRLYQDSKTGRMSPFISYKIPSKDASAGSI